MQLPPVENSSGASWEFTWCHLRIYEITTCLKWHQLKINELSPVEVRTGVSILLLSELWGHCELKTRAKVLDKILTQQQRKIWSHENFYHAPNHCAQSPQFAVSQAERFWMGPLGQCVLPLTWNVQKRKRVSSRAVGGILEVFMASCFPFLLD